MKIGRGAFALLLSLSVTACAGIIPAPSERVSRPVPVESSAPPPAVAAPRPVPAPAGENALTAGIQPGPPVSALNIPEDRASLALRAFRISCPSLVNRADPSGLTRAGDWEEPCEAASRWRSDPAEFFSGHFKAVRVGAGEAFATGYYEPEIAASREQDAEYRWPIYTLPDNRPNVTCGNDCGSEPLPLSRASIENGELAGRRLEIAWARDLVDLYFLQVQGSGILELPDGETMRVGYAGNNGYPYTSIGRLMRDRGLLGAGQATADGIAAWLRDNPERGRSIMQANRRYIFFTELTGPGPLGSLGRPVTPRATVAADPAFVPLGAPVFLDLEHDVADGLWIAQDTGSAIRGANRFDTFWGAGDAAYAIASGMASRGLAYILIPNLAAARLRAD